MKSRNNRPLFFAAFFLLLPVSLLLPVALADAGGDAPPLPPPLPPRTLSGLPGTWEMTFQEEFNGHGIDRAKWNVAWREFDKNGKIFYQPYRFRGVNLESNLTVNDGYLTIRSAKESVSWDPKVAYTTGVINTAEKFSQKYGYFEIRMQAPGPEARGTDAAFWLFCEANRWPPELDICEIPGSGAARKVLQNQHFVRADGGRGSNEKYTTLTKGDLSDGWHVFALRWEPGLLVWYVDGKETHRSAEHVPDEPMTLFCSTEIQGGWTGEPETGKWPQYQKVDYIRVYRRYRTGSNDSRRAPD